MKLSVGLSQVAGLLVSVTTLAATPLTFDLLHTVQNCQHPGHQKTWCDQDDIAPAVLASGLEQHINDQLDRALANPDHAHVYASEFSFSSRGIQTKMCALGKAGVAIEVYLDFGSSKDIAFTQDPNCQKDMAHPNLKGVLLGGFTKFPEWRLHHNKTVLIDAGDGTPLDIDFSSGNLSKFGTSLHMDHWVFIKAPGDSNLARATLCLFKGLEAASSKATEIGMYANGADFSKDPDVMQAYGATRDACYVSSQVIPMNDPEQAIALEGIAPFFTPNLGRQALETLKREFRSVIAQKQSGPAYLYIAIEHFSSQAIASLLNQAGTAGVDVRIIMNAGTVSGGTEVTSDGPFYEQNLHNDKMQVRFIEVNPNAGGPGIAQQMHNKFAILNGKRVFSGAGHYTSSGLDGNFESLYLTESPELTAKYAAYFKELWDESVDAEYITQGTPTSAPSALSPEFTAILK